MVVWSVLTILLSQQGRGVMVVAPSWITAGKRPARATIEIWGIDKESF
jgi:hypothetical protein